MAVAKFLQGLSGDYAGESRLNLSWMEDPIRICRSTAHVSVDPTATFAGIDYEWMYEGERQFGTILAVSETGAWTDSWHQSDAAMALAGTSTDLEWNVRGEYKVEGHPNWGWRIVLSPTEGGFRLQMFNLSPEGDEEWAVESEYLRV